MTVKKVYIVLNIFLINGRDYQNRFFLERDKNAYSTIKLQKTE